MQRESKFSPTTTWQVATTSCHLPGLNNTVQNAWNTILQKSILCLQYNNRRRLIAAVKSKIRKLISNSVNIRYCLSASRITETASFQVAEDRYDRAGSRTPPIVNISSRNSSIPRSNLIKYLALNWKWILGSIKYSAALIRDNEAPRRVASRGPVINVASQI